MNKILHEGEVILADHLSVNNSEKVCKHPHLYFLSSIDPFSLKSLKYTFIRQECKIRPIKKSLQVKRNKEKFQIYLQTKSEVLALRSQWWAEPSHIDSLPCFR